MKKAAVIIAIVLCSVVVLSASYLTLVRKQCIAYVESEIIGGKQYEVVKARLCRSPIIYSERVSYAWEVVVEPTRTVLDGGMPFYFSWDGQFLNLSDPNSLH